MVKKLKLALLILLELYLLLFADAYLIGFRKSNETIISLDSKLATGKKSAPRYWMITEKGKTNVDYALYSVLFVDSSIVVLRSKIFGNAMRAIYRSGDKDYTYEVCYTRMTSGLILTLLFFALTFVSFLRIHKGTYMAGKLNLTILLYVLFGFLLFGHLYT